MAKLIYTSMTSLDGYYVDAEGGFGWAMPDEEVHLFVNDLERPVGTYLYGRGLYETMKYWESPPDLAEEPGCIQDYAAIWQAADKVVYTRTLEAVSSARTRIERAFDPDAVARLKASAARDIGIGGGELAGLALRAGLVDEVGLFLNPAVVGGGRRALPDGLRLDLELVDQHRFGSGVVYVRYTARR